MKWKMLSRLQPWAVTLLCVVGCASGDRPAFFGAVPQSPVEPRTARRAPTTDVDTAVAEPRDRRAGSTLDHDPAPAAEARPPHIEADHASTDAEPSPDKRAQVTSKPPSSLDSAALTSVLKELQDLGTLEPDAQARLMQDLQKTDPALWPQMVTYFKATLAYQKKLQSAATGAPTTDLVANPAAPPPDQYRTGAPPEPARLTTVAAEPSPAATGPIERLPQATEPSVREQKTLAATAPLEAARPLDTAAAHEPATVKQATFEQSLPAALDPKPVDEPVPKSYDEQLRSMILTLETESRQSPGDVHRDINLRMLYLLASRGEDALRPIAGMPPEQQDFWSKQLYGLHTLFNPNDTSGQDVRRAEAAQHLSEATARLRESASLTVRNLAFCTEVGSYGVYKQFASHTFAPNQEVLLYAEVENLKSELVPDGFRTQLNSHYEIFDKQGTRVDEKDFGVTQEVCRNRRRDFFIRYQFNLPKRLHNGAYSLKLTVEDKHGEKLGQSSIDFAIKGAE